MKIIVIGAGAVGLHLARTLSWEGHDVVIIDIIQELVDRAASSMDVLAIRGSGTSAKLLIEAGAEHADLLIAVTSVDEVNILACMLAQKLGVKGRIARIRSHEYSQDDSKVQLSDLGIDQVIHPEMEAAREVAQMIQYPHAIDIVQCAGGKMFMVGVRVEHDAPIVNIALKDLSPMYPGLPFRIVAIRSGGETTIPGGFDIVRSNDLAYIITHCENINKIFELAGKQQMNLKNVMLLGGGMIGRMVAELMEEKKGYHIKMIESDADKQNRAVQRLKQTIVIKSQGRIDFDVLAIESLDEMDVFAALTDDDENNIVTSLFSNHLGVKRIITRITKPEYMAIAKAIGLEAAINERILTSDAIVKYLLGGRIMAMSTLRGIEAEIIEFAISANSSIAGLTLSEIDFPDNSIVGAVEHDGEVIVALGNTMVSPGDRLVMFSDPRSVPKLEKLIN
ncbi:Trk system potassium transporter TrkA [Calditrichota bacterium]